MKEQDGRDRIFYCLGVWMKDEWKGEGKINHEE